MPTSWKRTGSRVNPLPEYTHAICTWTRITTVCCHEKSWQSDRFLLGSDTFTHRSRSTFRYNGSALTPVFITRVFQECLTYNGEMDYKSYLDFVLALENRNSAQGLRYLFQIMDIDNKGYLHPGDLNFFYRVGAHGYRRRVTC